MCGISLIIDKKNRTIEKSLIEKMNNLAMHRGPDDEGYFFESGIAFGHRRLAVLDTSDAGHQPMTKGDHTIIFNGEIYNFVELRKELEREGITFSSSCDTEIILAAYKQWGQKCVTRFNGMWAFVIHDKKNRMLFCSRDRFGIKPFVYKNDSNTFYAASEAKQIVGVLDYPISVNLSAAVRFLGNGELNVNEETMFDGIFELPAGNNLIYDLDNHEYAISQWYSLEEITINNDVIKEGVVEEFYKLFMSSLKIRMRSDVTVGSCLSGGMDSSSIVCGVKRMIKEGTLTTVSSCYADRQYDEQEYIDEVTAATGFAAVKVFPDLDDLTRNGLLEKISYHQDQPIPECSHFSEYKVFETAKLNQLIVMLDGQGADEYLAGYGEFYIVYLKQLLLSLNLLKFIKEVRARAIQRGRSFFAELRCFFRSTIYNEVIGKLKNLLRRGDASVFTEKGKEIYSQCGRPKHPADILALSKEELRKSSLPYQLHSEDRNSMMHSVESRLPFLDYRLVEYVLSLPDEYKIESAITKKVLREAMKDVLPPRIYSRTDKMGFVAPDNEWMKKNPERMRKLLIESVKKIKVLVVEQEILNYYERFIEGKIGCHPVLFRVLAFSAWMNSFEIDLLNAPT